MTLGLIAAISLVVGGIGIMNSMLANVNERIREIGIRMAIGARSGHVMLQFLFESVLMCIIGGAAGLALASGVAMIATAAMNVDLQVTARHGLIAVLFAASVGVIFGYFPARQASKLSPAECIRRE